MDAREIQRRLNAHGFPCGPADGNIGPRTRSAVRRYQAAWAGLYGAAGLGWLEVDGNPGPATQRCLVELPALSWHFTTHELRSRGNGDCFVRRELVAGLEHLRSLIGPFAPTSGYRDPTHNANVGGARHSMHVLGLACDTPRRATVAAVQQLGVFSGIGHKNGLVQHVDLRHLAGPHNKTPHATPARPVIWSY